MATTIGALVARNKTLCTGVLFGATIAAVLAVVAMLR
jgi:hypothetical protein